MITSWQLYLIVILDSINFTAAIWSVIFGIGSLVSLIVLGAASSEGVVLNVKKWLYFTSCMLSLTILLGVFTALLPSTKQAAAILVIPHIATESNIDTMTRETSEIYGLAKAWIEKQIEDQELPNK